MRTFKGTLHHERYRILIGLLVLVVVIGLFLIALLFIKDYESRQYYQGEKKSYLEGKKSITVDGKKYALRNDIEVMLFIGLDKFEDQLTYDSYNNDQQADTLILLVLDRKKEACTAIHINRDTMAEVNQLGMGGVKIGTIREQIALAHTYGNGKEISCENTVKAVSKLLLGVEIDHYICMPMDGIVTINDMLGGVPITVMEDFTNTDPAMEKGKEIILSGKQALTYVRSRQSMEDPTNLNRMERQKQYVDSLMVQASKVYSENPSIVKEAWQALPESTFTDGNFGELQVFSKECFAYNRFSYCDLKGKAVANDYMEFYPDESALQKLVVDLFCEKEEK